MGQEGSFFPVKHSMLSPARVLFQLQQTIPNNWLPGGALPLPLLCDLPALWVRSGLCAPALTALMSSAEHSVCV